MKAAIPTADEEGSSARDCGERAPAPPAALGETPHRTETTRIAAGRRTSLQMPYAGAWRSSPAKFLAVGCANTSVGLAVIYGAKLGGAGDVPANAAGYAVGLCLSFTLNKSWTFGYTGPTGPALAKFLLVFAVAYALNLLAVVFSIDALGMNAYAAQATGIVPYTAFGYLASRHFAFLRLSTPHDTMHDAR